MGLGNNSGHTSNRRKGHLVKRIKEVKDARGYTAVLSTARQGTSACALSIGSNEYYHDGSGTFPAADDKVYSIKRAGTTYILEDGHYKMHNASDERTTKNIEISSGIVTRVTACP